MMKINTLFMMLFLLIGTFQLQGQIVNGPPLSEARCGGITVIDQECNRDGTVTISFRVDNNSNSTVTLVNVLAGSVVVGTSTTPIGPFSTGAQIYTFTAAANSLQCFNIYLYNERGGCCHREVCVRVQGCCDLETSAFGNDATCTTLGSAGISVWGGTPGYNGGWTNTTTGVTGIFPTIGGPISILVPNLALGNYTYWFVDRRGCRVEGTFRVGLASGNCDNFNFTNTPTNNPNIGVPIVAEVDATIGVTLDGLRVPDSVSVTVNGNVVLNFSAGAHPCDGPSWLSVGPLYFTVQQCDVVVFNVFSDVCNIGASWWDLYVTCRSRSLTSGDPGNNGKGDPAINPYSLMSDAELFEAEMNLLDLSSQERANLNSAFPASGSAQLDKNSESLNIFPNPVNEILNITNYNQEINYSKVRVLDGSGRTIIQENISGMLDLRIDASALQSGVYFLEITDETGNRVIEKFIKL